MLVKEKRLIMIGGIIAVCIGGYFCFFIFNLISGIINIVLGTIMIIKASKSDKDLLEKHGSLITLGILGIFFNLISSIFMFVAYSRIKNISKKITNDEVINTTTITNKPKEVISPEAKRIDILLKIGVCLVILSGIIFSTSNWEVISSSIKPFFLLILSAIFAFMSYIFKSKVIIKKSEITYDILSKIFILCFIIAIGFFKTLGLYLSFFGEGSRLMISIVCITSAILFFLFDKKYDKVVLEESFCASILFSLYFFIFHFDLDSIIIIGIFIVISGLLYLFKDKIKFRNDNVNYILTFYITFRYTILLIFDKIIFSTIFVGILLILMFIYRMYKNDKLKNVFQVLTPVYCCLLLYKILIISKTNTSYFIILIAMLILSKLFILSKEKHFAISGFCATALLSILIVNLMIIKNSLSLMLIPELLFIAYYTYTLYKSNNKIFYIISTFLQLLGIILLILNINFYIFFNYSYLIDIRVTFISIICVFVLLTIIQNKKYIELNFYKVFYCILIILLSTSSLLFLIDFDFKYIIISSCITYLYKIFSGNKIAEKHGFALNLLLICITYYNIIYIASHYVILSIANIFALVSLLISIYIFRKDKKTSALLLCLSYVPLFLLLKEYILDENLFLILSRLPLMVLVLIVTKLLLEAKDNIKFVLEIVFLAIIFLSYIFNIDIVIGLFTGLLAFIMIFLGFKFKKFNSLFWLGIVVTFVNIVVQLFEFWSSVPIFIYLLISGLIIIGFVTYKEINKTKKIKDTKDTKVMVPNQNEMLIIIDKHANILSILCLLAIVILFFNSKTLLMQQINLKTQNEKNKQMEEIFKSEKLDNIYLELENYNNLYDENYYDLKIVAISNESVDIEKILNLYEINGYTILNKRIFRVDKECFDIIKNINSSDVCYNDFDYEYYIYKPNKQFANKDVNIIINNKDINFLEIEKEYSNIYYITYKANDFVGDLDLCVTFNEDLYKGFSTSSNEYNYEKTYDTSSCFEYKGVGQLTIQLMDKIEQEEKIIISNGEYKILN